MQPSIAQENLKGLKARQQSAQGNALCNIRLKIQAL
jgi:hypothetical protein